MGGRRDELPVGVFGDRRRALRVPISVRCQAVTDEDFSLLGEEITDLSPRGLLLRAEGIPADVGEVVLVSFRPPRSNVWIDAEARIVRLLVGTERGAPGFALHIERIGPFEEAILAGAVERAAQPPAKRRRRPPRRRPRYVEPEAVAVRPLVHVDAGPTAPPRPRPTPVRAPMARAVPRATFSDAD